MEQEKWYDNSIQFPRLLAEIVATQDNIDMPALCDAMNLEEHEVDELFERAQVKWDAIKDLSGMVELGDRNYTLISRGAKMEGTLDPNEIFYAFEESLYMHEAEEIYAFLQWCHDNDKQFGHGNYEERFAEFKAREKT